MTTETTRPSSAATDAVLGFSCAIALTPPVSAGGAETCVLATPANQGMGICGDPMRICLVYDCLFPYTVGGAERWYRRLGERLAADGHDVTYLTLRQWNRGERADVAGVDVRAVGPRMGLYAGPGQRRILPPVVFGLGVLWHLARHGRRYDVVHTCSFPYFSLLAIALLAPLHSLRRRGGLVRGVEPELLAQLPGTLGRGRRRADPAHLREGSPAGLLLLTPLRAPAPREGLRGEITLLAGAYDGPLEPRSVAEQRARGGLRGPPHPGKAGPGDRPGHRPRARPAPRRARAHPRRRAGARDGAASRR